MLSVFCSALCNRIGDQGSGLKLLMRLEKQLNSNLIPVLLKKDTWRSIFL